MEIFLENMLKKFEAVKEIIELRQKLIEHYQQERQKQIYVAERKQKERGYLT